MNFILVLDVDSLATPQLLKAHEVHVLLSELIVCQLSEAQDTLVVREDARLFPDLPLGSFAYLFPCVYPAAWQLPRIRSEVKSLLDGEHLCLGAIEDKSSDAYVMTCVRWHFRFTVLWQPVGDQYIIVFSMVKTEAPLLQSSSQQMSLVFPQRQPNPPEPLPPVFIDSCRYGDAELFWGSCRRYVLTVYLDPVVAVYLATQDTEPFPIEKLWE